MTIKILDDTEQTIAVIVNGRCIGDRTYLSKAIHALTVCISNSLHKHFEDEKIKQIEAFENDLIALCKRYLIEFDIDATIIMYIFLRTVSCIFADSIKEDLDDY